MTIDIDTDSRRESAAVVAVQRETVPEASGNDLLTPQSIRTESPGKTYRIKPHQLAKAKAYWARKVAERKKPGNCGRCGNPNPDPKHKHCPDCRAYGQRYKSGKAGKTVVVYRRALDYLERRIATVEHSLALLQVNARVIYKRAHARGLKTGKEIRHYHGTLPELSKQELAQISHAYDLCKP